MHRFSKWAEMEYGIQQRVTATLLAGILVVILIPLFVMMISSWIEAQFSISRFDMGFLNRIPGGVLFSVGFALALWPIVAQLTRGRGTPLPMMATQELLVTGPFQYCRNPMSLGTFFLYLGLGIYSGSLTAIFLFLVLIGLLLLYLLKVEERELETRFGEAYLEYKSQVPFLLPKLKR